MIQIEHARFLCLSGNGDPGSKKFSDDIQALYTMAYAIMSNSKKRGLDFVVPKLEGMWWFDASKYKTGSITETLTIIPRSEWYYKLLLRIPDFVLSEELPTVFRQFLEIRKPTLLKM